MKPAPPFSFHRALKGRGEALPEHAHAEAQLTFAASGMVQMHTEAGRWLVPPQLAVWVPSGAPHRLEILTDAELWLVNWRPNGMPSWAPPVGLDRAFALRTTPLLYALLVEAITGVHDASKAELLVRLMLHELIAMPDAPTFLPLPSSAIGQRVATIALNDHRNRLDVGEVASRAATSVRTMSRLFPVETGLTYKAWRQRARIVRAMDHLGRGRAIAQVATELGFASTAAFSSAFRQVTAMTPSSFLGQPRQVPVA